MAGACWSVRCLGPHDRGLALTMDAGARHIHLTGHEAAPDELGGDYDCPPNQVRSTSRHAARAGGVPFNTVHEESS